MRFYASFSLAIGLVAASPCKPPSSTVVSDVISSSVATDTSSTLLESASSTVDSTTTTAETDVAETSTSADSTAIETSTAIGSTSTDFTEVSISTTESLVEPTSTATTSEAATSVDTTTALTTEASSVETSTAVATTTSDEAGPTGYFLVAGEGPALGGKVKSNGDTFTPMVFGDRGSTFNPCTRSMDPDWDTFFITNSGDYIWYLSSGTLQNDFMTTVKVFVDHVEASAPVQT